MALSVWALGEAGAGSRDRESGVSGANLSRAKTQCDVARAGRQAKPDRPQRQRCGYRVERGLGNGDADYQIRSAAFFAQSGDLLFRSRQASRPDPPASPLGASPPAQGESTPLRREVVDLSFEIKELSGRQKTAQPDAGGAQFRERALGDGIGEVRRRRPTYLPIRVKTYGYSLFPEPTSNDDAHHRPISSMR